MSIEELSKTIHQKLNSRADKDLIDSRLLELSYIEGVIQEIAQASTDFLLYCDEIHEKTNFQNLNKQNQAGSS